MKSVMAMGPINNSGEYFAIVLFELQRILYKDLVRKGNFLPIIKTFLIGIISTTADLINQVLPWSAQVVYADIEGVFGYVGKKYHLGYINSLLSALFTHI